MCSKKEPIGIQSLCLKLAYELCRHSPELTQELVAILDIMEADLLPPALKAGRKNVLQALAKRKGLQKGQQIHKEMP